MSIDPNTTLADIATGTPAATRVLERFGLDYCCGGRKSLSNACADKGLALSDVLAALGDASQLDADRTQQRDWRQASLTELIRHLLDKHHVYTREQLSRLAPLMQKVHAVHGDRHPELATLKQLLAAMDDDLQGHLVKEEQILFPYVTSLIPDPSSAAGHALEDGTGEARSRLRGEGGGACFATVAQPVEVMLMEHETVGSILAQMREVTAGYTLPEGACASYSALYHGLEDLEADLHQHIHLENNVLFPRALELESTPIGRS